MQTIEPTMATLEDDLIDELRAIRLEILEMKEYDRINTLARLVQRVLPGSRLMISQLYYNDLTLDEELTGAVMYDKLTPSNIILTNATQRLTVVGSAWIEMQLKGLSS